MSFLEPRVNVLCTGCVFFSAFTIWYSFIEDSFSEIFLPSVQKQRRTQVLLLIVSQFMLFLCIFWDHIIVKGQSEPFFSLSWSKMLSFSQSLQLPAMSSVLEVATYQLQTLILYLLLWYYDKKQTDSQKHYRKQIVLLMLEKSQPNKMKPETSLTSSTTLRRQSGSSLQRLGLHTVHIW